MIKSTLKKGAKLRAKASYFIKPQTDFLLILEFFLQDTAAVYIIYNEFFPSKSTEQDSQCISEHTPY